MKLWIITVLQGKGLLPPVAPQILPYWSEYAFSLLFQQKKSRP
jgi:hypothetical protein